MEKICEPARGQSLKTVIGEQDQSGDAELKLQTSGACPGLRWKNPAGFRCILLSSTRTRLHAFGGKHQHPLYHLVSGFPFRRIKGGVCSFVGQPQPAWAFINVSRTTLEKRLLWAVVKDHSKPLAGGQEKQSDGCSCSMSLPLIISLAFP